MGPYQISGESLTIGPLATTRMACAAEIMDQEQAYLKSLNATSAYRIVGTTLTLSDTSGTRTATFVAP
jgi:heat shock protein HslJ